MHTDLQIISGALVDALLNGAYQGLIVAGLVWLGFRLLPRTNAATRHAVCFAALLLTAILPAGHFLRSIKVDTRFFAKEPVSFITGMEESSGETPFVGRVDAVAGPVERLTPPRADMMLEDHPPVSPTEADAALAVDWVSAPAPVEKGRPQSRSAAPVVWQMRVPPMIAPILAGSWLALALVQLARLLAACIHLRRLKNSRVGSPKDLSELFVRLCVELRVRRRPSLLISPDTSAPMAVGYRRPAVLLPERVAQRAGRTQLEQLLRHELAHITRCDDWANLIQQAIRSILFFNPAVRWLCSRLSIEREIACDDHVLAATRERRSYALFLTEFAGQMSTRQIAAAPAAWSKKSQLKERINMILDTKRNAVPRLARARVSLFATAALMAALAAYWAGPRLALADEPSDDAKAKSVEVQESAPAAEQAADVAPSIVASEDGLTLVAPGKKARVKAKARASSGFVPGATLTLPPPDSDVVVNVNPLPPGALALVGAPPGAPDIAPDAEPAGGPEPRPARRPRRPEGDDIERRLDRLERLVESLVTNNKGPKMKMSDGPGKPNFYGEMDMKGQRNEGRAHEEDIRRMEEKVRRASEQAARDGERIARDAERRARDVERAVKEAQASMHANMNFNFADGREALEAQKHALEGQRHALEQQMRELERQMQRLERQRDKMDAERQDQENRGGEEHKNREKNKRKEKGGDRQEMEDDGPKHKE